MPSGIPAGRARRRYRVSGLDRSSLHNIGNARFQKTACSAGFDRLATQIDSHNNSRKTSTPALKLTRLLDPLREKICNLQLALPARWIVWR
jgi:hypothetical protein